MGLNTADTDLYLQLSQLDGAEQECDAFPEIQKQIREAFSNAMTAWNQNDYAPAKSHVETVNRLLQEKRNQEPTVEALMDLAETNIDQLDDDALDALDADLTDEPSTILEGFDDVNAEVMNRVNDLIAQIQTIDNETLTTLSKLTHSEADWETQYRKVREETVRQKIALIREIRVITAS